MQIGIVGGGIGGLTAAHALLADGHAVTVYEQAPALGTVGAGITLGENALRVYDTLGLTEALLAVGRLVDTAGIATASGRVLATITPDAYPGTPPRILGIHRAALQEVLVDGLPDGVLRLNRRVAGVSQDADTASVAFDDGTGASAELLIGADGLRSRVRAHLHGDVDTRYAGYTCWRGVIDDFPERPAFDGELLGSGHRFGLVPIGGGQLYWFATADAPRGTVDPPDGRSARLQERFAGWALGVPEVLRRTPDAAIHHTDLDDRPPSRGWSRGRIVLLGDAAHPTTPNMGQGAAMAIEDGPVLAATLREHPLSDALVQFEARRAPRTAWVTNRSRQFGAINQWAGVLGAVRNTAMALTPTWVLARQSLQLFDYDTSA